MEVMDRSRSVTQVVPQICEVFAAVHSALDGYVDACEPSAHLRRLRAMRSRPSHTRHLALSRQHVLVSSQYEASIERLRGANDTFLVAWTASASKADSRHLSSALQSRRRRD
jgi:hypothetical protein